MARQRFGDLTSLGGYRMDEVASALQNAIRRGDEAGALFWATELDQAGYGNYAWKRLRIIASEDVGIANSNVQVQVRALYDEWREMRRDVKEASHFGFFTIFLLHAVVLLARAPKSRYLDHVLTVYYEGERPKPEVPDYAVDKHTARGRRLRRGAEHFYDVGGRLEGCTVPDPYAELAKAIAIAREARQRKPDEQLELD
jgi:replication-associated recombination protein RarA